MFGSTFAHAQLRQRRQARAHTHTHTHNGWPHPLSAQASHTQNANCTISSSSRVSMMSHFVTASLAGGFLLPCGFFLIGRSARCACGTRAVRRCHLQRAQRGRQCRQCRGNGRGADAYAGGVCWFPPETSSRVFTFSAVRAATYQSSARMRGRPPGSRSRAVAPSYGGSYHSRSKLPEEALGAGVARPWTAVEFVDRAVDR